MKKTKKVEALLSEALKHVMQNYFFNVCYLFLILYCTRYEYIIVINA